MDLITHNLHTAWEFAFADHLAVQQASDINRLPFLPANVPGTNLTDLQAAGLVEPDTSPTYEDSFAPYAAMDFVYRTTFDAKPEIVNKRQLKLCFEGLDTVSEIWLNGAPLGQTENCHAGYEFDVKGKVTAGRNTLAIIFRSPLREAEKRCDAYGKNFPSPWPNSCFMFLRKPAYSYTWDWGPALPVSGIFRPVYLKADDRGAIDNFHVRYVINNNDVSGSVAVTVSGAEGARAVLRLDGREFAAPVSQGQASIAFTLPQARLWYPNGEGEPFLYDLEIILKDNGPIDARHHRIGFRTVEVVRDARKDGQGKRFVFRVNGREVFSRGYNWIPPDNSVPRAYGDVYRRLLDLTREGNVNMLRIWGGGYYETDEFYRLCDERGIMVWQDGMFACSYYPDDDPDFMVQVRAELVYNIRRLRNHASLVLWCGNNECHWGWDQWWTSQRDRYPRFYGTNVYDELFPQLVAELDPDRTYWNGSPYSEEPGVLANAPLQGDMHFWDLHTHCGDLAGYRGALCGFVSETGIQSLPDLRTALTVGTPEDRNIQSYVFDTRNHFLNPAKNDRLLKFTGALFRVSEDFNRAVILTNLAHGEYLKYATEVWRAQALDCAGLLVWQLNDCWPAISWAAIDYNLIPKACFHYLQRAFAPEVVGFIQQWDNDYNPAVNARGDLFVSSEHDGLKEGAVDLRIVRVTGEEVETLSWPVTLAGRGAVSLGEITLPEYKDRRFDCVAELTLRWREGGVAARNVYTFARPKHMRLPQPVITIEAAAPNQVRVRSDIFAKGVYLFHPDKAVVFGDNYFDLLPGETRVIKTSIPVDPSGITAFSYHH